MSARSEITRDAELLAGALEEASAVALEHYRGPREHWFKGPGQVLTEADLAVDRLLKDRLLGARPEDGWLSEETPDDGSRHTSRRVWVVDPIDGTRAFADRIPEWTISVALLIDGTPALGTVVNPATAEWFEAIRGGGLRQNGEPAGATGRRELAGARLLSSRGEIRKRGWRERLPESEIQTMGSLAYKLALVAAGRFDGFLSLRRSQDWDVAAAVLLLEAGGATLTDGEGRPLILNGDPPRHAGLVAAASQPLHETLLARLADIPG